MTFEAIYSDCTPLFVNPDTPKAGDRVRIRIRISAFDRANVYLCVKGARYLMRPGKSGSSMFCIFEITVTMPTEPFGYCFCICDPTSVYYYDRMGISEHIRPEFSFRIVPDFSVPEWAKGAIMYQILADRFARGDETNDVLDGEYFYIKTASKRIADWDELPKDFDVANFYGGDLKGAMEKLPYLKRLGVEAIYFNPLFVSPSNHKYDAQDYDHIDPHVARIVSDGGNLLADGDKDNTHATRYIKRTTDPDNLKASNDFFAEFIARAHELGIKVIMDGVFNHCGSFHKWLDREGIYKASGDSNEGAYWSAGSPYRDYFSFSGEREYEGWWDHNTLPKLNYEGSSALKDEIMRIAAKWVSPPYNADGWRLDVAADLGHSPEYNHEFWKEFRRVVKEANPEAIILAEHYGYAGDFLKGDEWDTVMNYDAFMEPVSYFLTGMEKHSDRFDASAVGDGRRFEDTMKHAMLQFMSPSLLTAMNQLSNHDHSRFMTRTNKTAGRVATHGSEAAAKGINPAIFRQGVVMLMTLPGAPTLYYGDEAGVVGFTDPDSRRTYPWGKEDTGLIDFHRDIIYLHKNSHALRSGSFLFLASGAGYTSYARFDEGECYVAAFNTTDREMQIDIPVWIAGAPRQGQMLQVITTYGAGYSIFPVEHRIESGNLHAVLAPYGSAVFRMNI